MDQEYPFSILVVDDEPPIVDLLERVSQTLFSEARYINTRTAQETLTYVDQDSAKLPQLVLMDVDLHAATNGFDLLPRLQERFKGKVPIVIFTVSTDQDDCRRATAEGAVAFTHKPDDLDGWKAYVAMLRAYWYNTARVPLREDLDW